MAVQAGEGVELARAGEAVAQFAQGRQRGELVGDRAHDQRRRGDGLRLDPVQVDGLGQREEALRVDPRGERIAPAAEIVADVEAERPARGLLQVEPVGELLRRAVGRHGQLARELQPVLRPPGVEREAHDAPLYAAPADADRVGPVRRADQAEPPQRVRVVAREGQPDHAAIGAADERVGRAEPVGVHQRLEPRGLVRRGDRLGAGAVAVIRPEVVAEHAPAARVDRPAGPHQPPPPAPPARTSVGNEAGRGDAAQYDAQGSVLRSVEPPAHAVAAQRAAALQCAVLGLGLDVAWCHDAFIPCGPRRARAEGEGPRAARLALIFRDHPQDVAPVAETRRLPQRSQG